MKCVKLLVKVLLIVGALNWGLVGFFQYDAVADLFGGVASTGARVVYSLVGLAGLFKLSRIFCGCSSCCKCGPNCNCGCSSKKNHQ
ncbi:MAG TPA: DUF378 domain-containing protein [Chlamydiales bacterium]|jgi:hypothetical protein